LQRANPKRKKSLTPTFGLLNMINIDLENLGNETALNEVFTNHTVKKIVPARLFFLTTRRNAWNSTIINRYDSSNPIFFKLQEAKDKAEELRKKGSSFIIGEIPSIILDCSEFSIPIIQINTETPFRDYSLNALEAHENQIRRKVYGYLSSYLHAGVNAHELLQTFRRDSNFWSVNQPEKNSVIALYSRSKECNYCKLYKKKPLNIYKSSYSGSGYCLGWEKEVSDEKSYYINKLIDQVNGQNKQSESNNVVSIKKGMKRTKVPHNKTRKIRLTALALSIEYFTKIEKNEAFVKEGLKSLKSPNEGTHYCIISEEMYAAIMKMPLQSAVEKLLYA